MVTFEPYGEDPGAAPRGQAAAPMPNDCLRGIRVLVAEDTADLQLLLGWYLETAGAEIGTALNGREAVSMAQTHPYDILLMDLQMPEMDGYEAVSRLRSEGFAKPIIALTAHVLKDERDLCLQRGFNDHVSKPISRQQLIERIAKYVGRS